MEQTSPQLLMINQPLKVLIIEDNEVDRKVLESMLKDAISTEYLKSTKSLKEGLEQLKKRNFDAVILDLNLPDSEGKDTVEYISSAFPSLAVVVNTGAFEDDLGIKTLSLGAQDFLVKGKYSAYTLNKALYYAVERKRLLNEILHANTSLKAAQEQLVQSEKLKVVGALATGVAHEVKNPLSTIVYGVTFLAGQINESDQQLRDVLKEIKDAAERANLIITDLLDFSCLNTLKQQKHDLPSVLQKSLTLLKHEIEKKHLTITKEISSVPQLFLDRNRIEQVIINLVLNAIYASDDKTQILIKIEHLKSAEAQNDLKASFPKELDGRSDFVVLSICDKGRGIPEKDLSKIYDPFFTTRRAQGGTGLGLSVSRNIMSLHKGFLQIQNNTDCGITARLYFKVEKGDGGEKD